MTAVLLVVVLGAAPALAEEVPVDTADGVADDEAADEAVAQLTDGLEAEQIGDRLDDAEVALADDEEEEEASRSLIHPFRVSLSITDTFNLGAIFRDSFTVTNYNLLSFGLTGSYATPIDSLSVSLGLSVSKYTTEAGGSTFQREARFGDIRLGASYGSIWSDPDNTGLNLSGSLGFVIPTSEYSRFTNLYTSTSLGLGLSRSFGNLSIRLGVNARKNFNSHTSVVVDNRDLQLDLFARDGGTENIGEGLVAIDTGVLSEWGFGTSLGLTYNWFEGFSTSLSFSLNNNWTYDNGTITQNDEFTNPNARPGRGFGQSMSGSISASYAFLDHFSASLSMSTSQPVKTADNQRVRFPFFDFESGNLQYTTVSLGLTASY